MTERITITDQDGTELISVDQVQRRQDRKLEQPEQYWLNAITVLELGCTILAGLSIGCFLVLLICHLTKGVTA